MSDRSLRTLSVLADKDPAFTDLCESLYGTVDVDLVHEDVFGQGVDYLTIEQVRKDASTGPGRGKLLRTASGRPVHAVPHVNEMAAGAYQAARSIQPEAGETSAVAGAVKDAKATFSPAAQKAGNFAGKLLAGAVNNKKATAGALLGGAALHAQGKKTGRKQGYQEAAYGKSDSEAKSRRLAQVGQVGNGIAIAGGVHALGAAAANPKLADGGPASRATYRAGLKIEHALQNNRATRRLHAAVKKNPKIGGRLAAGALGLHVAELGADGISHHFLHQASKKKGSLHPVEKADIAKPMPDLELAGTFSKFDDDKRQAFGYASVVKKDGLPVVDRQGDYIDMEEMEKAAYHYVQKSRVGGDMHRRQADEYGIDRAHHVSDLIESMVFTPEKCKAMGLPDEIGKKLEGHWWVGYQIHDEDTWQQVRKQGRTGFSIHGRGKRVDTTIDELVAS